MARCRPAQSGHLRDRLTVRELRAARGVAPDRSSATAARTASRWRTVPAANRNTVPHCRGAGPMSQASSIMSAELARAMRRLLIDPTPVPPIELVGSTLTGRPDPCDDKPHGSPVRSRLSPPSRLTYFRRPRPCAYRNVAAVISARKNSPSAWRSVPHHQPARNAAGMLIPANRRSSSTVIPNG